MDDIGTRQQYRIILFEDDRKMSDAERARAYKKDKASVLEAIAQDTPTIIATGRDCCRGIYYDKKMHDALLKSKVELIYLHTCRDECFGELISGRAPLEPIGYVDDEEREHRPRVRKEIVRKDGVHVYSPLLAHQDSQDLYERLRGVDSKAKLESVLAENLDQSWRSADRYKGCGEFRRTYSEAMDELARLHSIIWKER